MRQKALVAMSGGVDSAVTAALMAQEYDCVGATMRLHDYGACGSADDARDAAAVAAALGMPHTVLDFSADFSREVIDRFVSAYERGDTPNPCIECNRHLKFTRLYEEARRMGCDVIATGHYARITYDKGTGLYSLRRARCMAKDQTYVLYFLSQEQLAHTRFPLGEMDSKQTVRQRAEAYGFDNAHKRDSQDICFIPDGRYADFIRRRTGREYPVGDFVDTEGRVLGQHRGIIGYTIGQRKGLGLSLPAPLYVCRKEMTSNRVVLAPEEALYTNELTARCFHWIAGEPPAAPRRVTAKTRYAAKEAPATVTPLPDGGARVTFDAPQRAITVGQAVVLYDGDVVVGGGTISYTQ
ncbi:MAG: tRNA 2-thiouridine(34) synthase MnmA [Ruminococcaceae bacterium]|nr:tRNA 2-thiouridine(34) synthase MnmA [Oscillospiraceae bacterium]